MILNKQNKEQKRRVRLHELEELFASLSEVVQFTEYPICKLPPERVKGLRDEFEQSIRSDFYKALAVEESHTLRRILDLDDYDLGFTQAQGFLPPEIARRIDLNVDHIRPIPLNGDNSLGNLALLPKKINNLKNTFEDLQRSCLNASLIRVVTPKLKEDGTFHRIPIFPREWYYIS